MGLSSTLDKILEFVGEDNWVDCGDYLIFGWDEYIAATGDPKDIPPSRSSPEEALLAKGSTRVAWEVKQMLVPRALCPEDRVEFVEAPRTESGDMLIEFGAAKWFVDSLPGLVERHRRLDVLLVDLKVSSEIQAFFKEACLCYVLGMKRAAMMLLRSSLELALEFRLQKLPPDERSKAEDFRDREGPLGRNLRAAERLGLFSRQEPNPATRAITLCFHRQ